MRLDLSEEQELLRASFSELFAAECSPARVRAAEPLGFDPDLWKHLLQTGAVGMRVPEPRGGGGASLLDAAVVAGEAGRRLAPVPLAETLVACALLARCPGPAASGLLERALAGAALVTLVPRPASGEGAELVPGGAVADAALALVGDALVLVSRESERPPALPNLGSAPWARWPLGEGADAQVLARGAGARRLFGAACEEWRLLTAAALCGLAREALEIAAAYAGQREQFGRPIGSFQGIAHPLADAATAVEGGRLLVWKAIGAIARGDDRAAALVPMAFAWAALAAGDAVGRALHTHGGYGLSLEYDVQLYQRRGKAWALAAGDPRDELLRAAERLWGDAGGVALPEAGEVGIDFGLGPRAEAFREELRAFFEAELDEELRQHAHFSWDGHHPGFQRRLAAAGLLFPTWPEAYGGQGRDPYEASVLMEEYHRAGWTIHAIVTTRMVGESLMRFASEELKQEVLPRICRGEAVVSLGYTEPGAGSDVAAAQTRARRDGDSWVIDGQKMFTSGANLAQYVFLLTRTDPTGPKHRALTLFLVPLDSPGIEIQPVETLSDERTNITYYNGVRVPDRYRVGEENGGWQVLSHALELEHGSGGGSVFTHDHERLVDAAVAWARSARRDGRPALEDPRVRERLALAATRAEVSWVLARNSLWSGVEGVPDRAQGPMNKLFSSEAFVRDACDLLDLAAPESLLGWQLGAAAPAGEMELAYRLSAATTIYGGTSEIMRSIISQAALGMPRSRS